MIDNNIEIKKRLWLVGKYGTFLGEGRIALLQKIDEYGSISKASQALGMSYLKAWKLIDSMNKICKEPLVIKSSGGKGGGGTTLTENGRNAITLYLSIIEKCDTFLEREFDQLLLNSSIKLK